MAGKVRNYYAGGNTARGFYSLFESNLQGLERLYILKGGPGTGKSTLIKTIGGEWADKGYDIEFVHCSSDNGSLDGVIIRELKAGIVDGTPPHIVEPKAPGAVEEYVNLGAAWNSRRLIRHKDDIVRLTARIDEAFRAAYSHFAKALQVHDEWENIYVGNMDVAKANEVSEQFIETWFAGKTGNKRAEVRHRFLGAATPKGPVDFIPNLTEDVKKRYFIKGRPGSGKSTMLKKLAQTAEQKGFDTEVYHCGFDPNSLDMVIVRELGFAIFDSTSPHEYYPDRESDEIVDMYTRAITPGTDEKYVWELKDIKERYSNEMRVATSWLAQAKSLHDELEKFYIEATDFDKVNELRDEIGEELEALART